MLSIDLTDDAAKPLQSQIASYSLPQPGVVIVRRGKAADLVRQADGNASWTIDNPHPWAASVLSLDGLPVGDRVELCGISFFTIKGALAHYPPLRISVSDGTLHVDEVGA